MWRRAFCHGAGQGCENGLLFFTRQLGLTEGVRAGTLFPCWWGSAHSSTRSHRSLPASSASQSGSVSQQEATAPCSQHRVALLESIGLWRHCSWCWTAGSCDLKLQRHGWERELLGSWGAEQKLGSLQIAGRAWPCEHPAEPCSLQSRGQTNGVLPSVHWCQLFRFRLLTNCRPINNSGECLLSGCCRDG